MDQKTIILIIAGIIFMVGIALGIYFLTRKSDSGSDEPSDDGGGGGSD